MSPAVGFNIYLLRTEFTRRLSSRTSLKREDFKHIRMHSGAGTCRVPDGSKAASQRTIQGGSLLNIYEQELEEHYLFMMKKLKDSRNAFPYDAPIPVIGALLNQYPE